MIHIAFTKLVVNDLEAAHDFYTSVFGLVEVGRVSETIGGRPIDEIMYQPTSDGGRSFVLLRFGDRTHPSSDDVIVGVMTDDLGGLMSRAVAAGGRVVDDVRSMPEHGIDVAFLADNEGHLIEVVRPRP